MGNSRREKNVGLSQVIGSSDFQVKTFEFYSINKEETLKMSKQSNVDLIRDGQVIFRREKKPEDNGSNSGILD